MLNKILTATAQLDDAAAMAGFLAAFPNSDELGQFLAAEQERQLLHIHRYDNQTRAYYFVVRDGQSVRCFTVVNLSYFEATTIADECVEITTWDFANFKAAVERALGLVIERVH
jgi:hypothetical protein